MSNTKKRNAIIGIALALVLGIGGTLAYLSAVTGTKTNTFTMGSGITGETEEPKWDPEKAENFVPGRVIAKDPQIVNNSAVGTDPAWVAAKISYQVMGAEGKYVDTTYADLDQFINIQTNGVAGFNSTDWIMADDNTTAYYKTTLAAKASDTAVAPRTSAIFTDVQIDPLALTPDQVASAAGTNVQFDTSKYTEVDAEGNVKSYTTYQMKDFQIVVTGYMVQSEGFDSAQTAMKTAFSDVFK